MANLVPFDEYVQGNRAHWRSIRTRIGLMFGLGMGLFSLAMGDVGIVGAIIIAAFAGTLFAVLWVASMQITMRRLLRRIYEADAKIVGVEPTESEYPFRLPCSLLRSPTLAVGGVLHLGRADWRFVPHQRNLPRHREIVSIAPLENLELAMVPGRLTWLSRLFVARAPDLLELRWNGQTAHLVVPNPESTAQRLRDLRSRAA
jgi:hypothetical protein